MSNSKREFKIRRGNILSIIPESDPDSLDLLLLAINSPLYFDRLSGSSTRGANADNPPTSSRTDAAPDLDVAPSLDADKSNMTKREKQEEARGWYNWWSERHGERYGSGSRHTGSKSQEDQDGGKGFLLLDSAPSLGN